MNQEELIQKQIEEGNTPQGMDGEAYRLVFRALKKEPTHNLSSDFAKRVASLAQAPSKGFDWDKFFLFAGIGVFGIILLYAAAVTNFTPSFGAFQFLKGYPMIIVLAVLLIAVGQWLDTRIIRKINT